MTKNRSAKGESLVAVLISALLMGIVAAAIGSLAVLSTSESTKLQSRVASVDEAKFALDRMGRLVRMARNVGDLQGTVQPATDPTIGVQGTAAILDYGGAISPTVPVAQVEDGTACNMSATFPSVGDPYYGPSGMLLTGASWPWGGKPYTLDGQTLIVQVPTFDANGYPNKALQTNPNVQNLQALDTYVYKITPDPEYQNQMKLIAKKLTTPFYKLEVAGYPAEAASTNFPAGWKTGVPNIVLRGIVGPLDKTGKLTCFQYVNQRAIAGAEVQNSVTTNFDNKTAVGALNEQNLPLFTGVIANFQIMMLDGKAKPTVQTMRSEMFLRNNAAATIMGTPPAGG
jgi:hypothetical protein